MTRALQMAVALDEYMTEWSRLAAMERRTPFWRVFKWASLMSQMRRLTNDFSKYSEQLMEKNENEV